MNPRLLLPVIFLCIFIPNAGAQTKHILQFDELKWDFGDIKEEVGHVSHTFHFTNISAKPIFLDKVEANCGCTTPDWTKDTIQPGAKGFVKATFETLGRSGPFHKNVYVYPNVPDYYRFLEITGNVIPKPVTKPTRQEFPNSYANLTFRETVANFDGITNLNTLTKSIKLYNDNSYPIKIYRILDKPEYVTVRFKDSILRPKDSSEIFLTIKGSDLSKPGEFNGRIQIETDDPNAANKFLFLLGHLKYDYSKMSKKELKEAPVFSLTPRTGLDLGNVKQGAIVKRALTITNEGLTDLKIFKIQPSCSCVSTELTTSVVKPGETISIQLSYDSVNQAAAGHRKWLTFFTNDPKNSEMSYPVAINVVTK